MKSTQAYPGKPRRAYRPRGGVPPSPHRSGRHARGREAPCRARAERHGYLHGDPCPSPARSRLRRAANALLRRIAVAAGPTRHRPGHGLLHAVAVHEVAEELVVYRTITDEPARAVLAHARAEEQEVLPLIVRYDQALDRPALGPRYRAAKRRSPTRPHPRAPQRPPGTCSRSGAFVDRVRDRLR